MFAKQQNHEMETCLRRASLLPTYSFWDDPIAPSVLIGGKEVWRVSIISPPHLMVGRYGVGTYLPTYLPT